VILMRCIVKSTTPFAIFVMNFVMLLAHVKRLVV
jgi:hypothetical protein